MLCMNLTWNKTSKKIKEAKKFYSKWKDIHGSFSHALCSHITHVCIKKWTINFMGRKKQEESMGVEWSLKSLPLQLLLCKLDLGVVMLFHNLTLNMIWICIHLDFLKSSSFINVFKKDENFLSIVCIIISNNDL